jgi:N-carbamoylputrescine amidase
MKYDIAVIQMRSAGDVASNREKIIVQIKEAARRGAKVICTQELFCSDYFCQREDIDTFNLAESIPGPTTDKIGSVARDLGVVVIASLFERRHAGLYHNTAAVVDADGKLLGIYRKMHIPDDPLYYEKYYFTPGDLGFKTFQTRYGRVGVLVCWDQWFPEGARLTALQGAEVIFYPTAIGWHPREKAEFGAAQLDAWQTVQRSHAIANGVFVAAANRVGHEGPADGGIEFFGGSFICDPFGRWLAKAGNEKEEILVATVDTELQETVRRNWPFLRDRRIDMYEPITRRFLD